jgi:hypothetical protein
MFHVNGANKYSRLDERTCLVNKYNKSVFLQVFVSTVIFLLL